MRAIQLIIAILLFPLTVWYAVGVALRNCYFDSHVPKSSSHDSGLKTIGVGNLRMGGTGKTPHTEYLISLIIKSTLDIAFLSRGYGRKTKGFVLADTAGGDVQESRRIGDEPAMIARKFPDITVAVSENRVEGLRRLSLLPSPPEIVLLDDVYQHRRVRPDILILLTEYRDPYFLDHILPFGNLREFRSGSRRADIVVVTKCPPSLSKRRRDEYREKLRLQPNQKLFFSQIEYQSPKPLFPDGQQSELDIYNCRDLLLVTGIAHPEPLKHHLEKRCTVKHLRFPDHHRFTESDCRQIAHAFQAIKSQSKAIVTTEKDAMRLQNLSLPDIQSMVYYIPISVTFLEGDTFDKAVSAML